MKQNSDKKMQQQLKNLTNLLTEMRLKEKEGTHKTLVKIKLAEILTVPMCVTTAELPFGNLTFLVTREVIDVRNETEQTIWSVAPVSMTHGYLWELCIANWKRDCEEKTECFPSRLCVWKAEKQKGLPVISENKWSWLSFGAGGTKISSATLARSSANSCWHWSEVIGSWGWGWDMEHSETWLAEEICLPFVNLYPGGYPCNL